MIALPRSWIRTCRSVFQRLARREPAVVTFETGADGLRIRLHRTAIRAEYHQAGARTPLSLAVPLAALADWQAKHGDVSLEFKGQAVTASWQDRGFPQAVSYPAEDATRLLSYPQRPKKWFRLPGAFRQALADAARTAAAAATRYALQQIQLRPNGQIAATDGRQLLVQSGFPLDLHQALLIPASPVFGCPELAAACVDFGHSDSHVLLGSGPWTLYLPICKGGRFPRCYEHIPRPEQIRSRCQLAADDVKFLRRSLARLPGAGADGSPVTLDLDGQVLVRGQHEGPGRPTELVLARSTVEGVPVRTRTDRSYLLRALQLGFTEIGLVNASSAILCRDDCRQYVWMPLGQQGALPPMEDAVRIRSGEPERSPAAPAIP